MNRRTIYFSILFKNTAFRIGPSYRLPFPAETVNNVAKGIPFITKNYAEAIILTLTQQVYAPSQSECGQGSLDWIRRSGRRDVSICDRQQVD